MPYKDLADPVDAESSATIRARVETARCIQRERLAPYGLHANAAMAARHIRKFCQIDDQGQKLLEMVTDKLGLSARSYSRILKVARTIADLAGEENIRLPYLPRRFSTGGWIGNIDEAVCLRIGGKPIRAWLLLRQCR
ncbi:MAG: ATP-binding protein [Desulfuromonadales bacterium]|nr:ATP-binding protein [Desulfuromonadales bacterium]